MQTKQKRLTGQRSVKKLTAAKRLPQKSNVKKIENFLGFFLANAPASDKKDLLSELELMKKLKPHPHVIKLLGCVTETGKGVTFQFIEFVAFKFSW